jgi:hypothetical protein
MKVTGPDESVSKNAYLITLEGTSFTYCCIPATQPKSIVFRNLLHLYARHNRIMRVSQRQRAGNTYAECTLDSFSNSNATLKQSAA